MNMMTLNFSPCVQLWIKSVVISTSLVSNHMTPNVLLPILPSFQKSESRIPLIIHPSLLVWIRGYPCVIPSKVASKRLMSAISMRLWLWTLSSLMSQPILGHGGTTMLQLYCGCDSELTAVFPLKTEREMAGTLEDFI
jgi:hypothetical protein